MELLSACPLECPVHALCCSSSFTVSRALAALHSSVTILKPAPLVNGSFLFDGSSSTFKAALEGIQAALALLDFPFGQFSEPGKRLKPGKISYRRSLPLLWALTVSQGHVFT